MKSRCFLLHDNGIDGIVDPSNHFWTARPTPVAGTSPASWTENGRSSGKSRHCWPHRAAAREAGRQRVTRPALR